jgi:hypothetical protein
VGVKYSQNVNIFAYKFTLPLQGDHQKSHQVWCVPVSLMAGSNRVAEVRQEGVGQEPRE